MGVMESRTETTQELHQSSGSKSTVQENPVYRAAYDEEEALYQLSLQKKSADGQQASSKENDAS